MNLPEFCSTNSISDKDRNLAFACDVCVNKYLDKKQHRFRSDDLDEKHCDICGEQPEYIHSFGRRWLIETLWQWVESQGGIKAHDKQKRI